MLHVNWLLCGHLNDLVVKRELRPWEVHLRSHSWGHVFYKKKKIWFQVYINNPPSSPSPPPLSRQEVKSNPVLSLSPRNSHPSLFTKQRSELFLTTSTTHLHVGNVNEHPPPTLPVRNHESDEIKKYLAFRWNHIVGYQFYVLFFPPAQTTPRFFSFFHKLVPVSLPALPHFFLTVAPYAKYLLLPFCRKRNWGSERWSTLPGYESWSV